MRSLASCRTKTVVALFFMLVAANGARAGGFFDVMFNDETADLWGAFELGRKDDDDSGFLLGARYLYSDKDDVDSSVPAAFAAFSGRPEANEAIRYRAGIQWFVGGDAEDLDVQGVAIGGSATWAPENWKGAFAGGRLYYAPEVFTSGDTEGILDWAVDGGYRVNERFRVFLEYAKMRVDFEGGGDADANDGLLLGVGFGF